MKPEIALLETKLQDLSDKLFLLKNKPDVYVKMAYHEQVILPLQNILALAENIESNAGQVLL